MNKVAIGFITMNAGEDIRGSTLKWAISRTKEYFDYIVVVDGHMTDEARKYYRSIPNLRAVDSPWKNRHAIQYVARNRAVDKGDWLLAMDDDECPYNELVEFCKCELINDSAKDKINIYYLPSVTHIVRQNDNKFYRCEEYPHDEERCLKRILYKNDGNIDFITSNCGMHVTPAVINTQYGQRVHADRSKTLNLPYYHMKSLESFMINDCVYVMSDPRPKFEKPESRGFTEQDVNEIEYISRKHQYYIIDNFINATKKSQWPKELKDFAFRFSNLGQTNGKTCSRFYILYYILQRTEQAPIEYTYDTIFQHWSKRLHSIYQQSLNNNEYVIADHTPIFWKDIFYTK